MAQPPPKCSTKDEYYQNRYNECLEKGYNPYGGKDKKDGRSIRESACMEWAGCSDWKQVSGQPIQGIPIQAPIQGDPIKGKRPPSKAPKPIKKTTSAITRTVTNETQMEKEPLRGDQNSFTTFWKWLFRCS